MDSAQPSSSAHRERGARPAQQKEGVSALRSLQALPLTFYPNFQLSSVKTPSDPSQEALSLPAPPGSQGALRTNAEPHQRLLPSPPTDTRTGHRWAPRGLQAPGRDPARCSGGPHCQPGTWWEGRSAYRYCPSWTWSRPVSASLDIPLSLALAAGAKAWPEPTWCGFTGSLLLKDLRRHSCASDSRLSPGAWNPGQPQPAAQDPLILWAVNRPTGAREAADLPWGESRGLLCPRGGSGGHFPRTLLLEAREWMTSESGRRPVSLPAK